MTRTLSELTRAALESGDVERLLALHRATFGGATMTAPDGGGDGGSGSGSAGGDTGTPPADPPADDPADLGEAGRKALNAERTRAAAEERARKAADARASKAEQELETLRKRTQSADERALEEAKRTAAAEAVAPAKRRVLEAELRAAAVGKLADPADALRYADLVTLPEVGDDLSLDSAALSKAVAELLKAKPHLAATPPNPGSADGGARTSSLPADASPTSRMAAAYAAGSSRR